MPMSSTGFLKVVNDRHSLLISNNCNELKWISVKYANKSRFTYKLTNESMKKHPRPVRTFGRTMFIVD